MVKASYNPKAKGLLDALNLNGHDVRARVATSKSLIPPPQTTQNAPPPPSLRIPYTPRWSWRSLRPKGTTRKEKLWSIASALLPCLRWMPTYNVRKQLPQDSARALGTHRACMTEAHTLHSLSTLDAHNPRGLSCSCAARLACVCWQYSPARP